MSLHCVNPKSNAVIDLAKELGLNPYIAAAKIAVWQDNNGLENWPTASQLSGIKEGVSELFEYNPELSKIGNEQQYSKYISEVLEKAGAYVKDILWHGTDADLGDKFDYSKRNQGSGSASPHMVGHVYSSFQRYSTIPYITGQGTNRPDKKFILQFFAVKELFKKGNKKNEDDISWWNKKISDLIISEKHLSEFKKEYGISDDVDKMEALKQMFDILPDDTFNSWKNRKKEYYKSLKIEGKAPYAIISLMKNPLVGKSNDTRYAEELKEAERNENDGLVMYDNNDAFNSDVVVTFNESDVHILGSKQDIEGFKAFIQQSDTTSPETKESVSEGFRLRVGDDYESNKSKYIEEVERISSLIQNKLKIKFKSFTGKYNYTKLVDVDTYLSDVLQGLLKSIGLSDDINSVEDLKSRIESGEIKQYIESNYNNYKSQLESFKDKYNTTTVLQVLDSYLKNKDLSMYADWQQNLIKQFFPRLFGDLGKFKSQKQAEAFYKNLIKKEDFFTKSNQGNKLRSSYYMILSKYKQFETLINYMTIDEADFNERIPKLIQNELNRRSEFFGSKKVSEIRIKQKEELDKAEEERKYRTSVKYWLDRWGSNQNSKFYGTLARILSSHTKTIDAIHPDSVVRFTGPLEFGGGVWSATDAKISAIAANDTQLAHTLIHEIAHHFSVPYILRYFKDGLENKDFYNKYPELLHKNDEEDENTGDPFYLVDKLTEHEIESIRSLEKIYMHVVELHKSGKIKLSNENAFSSNADYGLSSIYEFISEVTSNPYFAKQIASQPSMFDKTSNLFRDIISALVRLMGINDKSLLNDALYFIEDAFFNKDDQYKNLNESKDSIEKDNDNNSFKLLVNESDESLNEDGTPIDDSNKSILNNHSKFVNKILQGLKSQEFAMSKDKNVSSYDKKRLQLLITKIEEMEDAESVIEFIKHMFNTLNDISKKLEQIDSDSNKEKRKLTAEVLEGYMKDYVDFYDTMFTNPTGGDSISTVMQTNPYFKEMSTADREALEKAKDVCLKKISDLKTSLAIHRKAITLEFIDDIIKESGSPADINEIAKQLDETTYDMSTWSRFITMPTHAKDEIIRIVQKALDDASSTITREVNAINTKLRNAYDRLDKKHKKVHNFIYELDDDGKYTGWLVSGLKRGLHDRNYRAFVKELNKEIFDKYGIELSGNRRPPKGEINGVNVRKYYNNKLNQWHAENTERRYVPEFYEMFNDLDPITDLYLEDIRSRIFDLIGKYIDESGKPQLQNMTDTEYQRYEELIKERANLANTYDINGYPKIGKDLIVAEDLKRLNKKKEGIKYKENKEAFEKAKAKAKAELSPEMYDKWIKRNTRTVYTQKFWDDLASLSTVEHQSDLFKQFYESRQELLSLYRFPNSMEINTDAMTDDVKIRLKNMDWEIDRLRKSIKSQSKLKFLDIATIEYNQAYHDKKGSLDRRLAAAKLSNDQNEIAAAKKALEEFDQLVHYFVESKSGIKYKKVSSAWSIMKPKDIPEYIQREVPNIMWSEIDPQSKLLNSKFNESESEYGFQPRRDKYDDSKRMDYINNNSDLKDYYKESLDIMETANNKIEDVNRKKTFKAAQISESVYGKFMSGEIKEGSKKIFGLNETEKEQLGYVQSRRTRADGEEIKQVKKFFIRTLDNPATITKDHLWATMQYVNMAISHNRKTELSATLNLLLDQVASRSLVNEDGAKRAKGESTNIYKYLEHMINTRVYSDRFGADTNAKNAAKWFEITRKIVSYFRNTKMFANVSVVLSGFVESVTKAWQEAVVGSLSKNNAVYRIANKLRAEKEIALFLLEAAQNAMNPLKKPFLISIMEYNGLYKPGERDKRVYRGAIRHLNADSWYIGYNQIDFAAKAKLAVAVMDSYRLANGEFLTESEFCKKYYPNDRKLGESLYGELKESLYDAYELNEFNQLVPKSNYKDAITSSLENRVQNKILHFSQKLDGTLNDRDRIAAQDNAVGMAMILFRSFMVVFGNERYKSKTWNYSTGNVEKGMMKTMLADLLKISQLGRLGWFKEFVQNNKFEKGIDEANYMRAMFDVAFRISPPLLLYYFILLPLSKKMDDDDDGAWWTYYAMYLSRRLSFEAMALYSPTDIINILNSPSAATSLFDTPYSIFQGVYKSVTAENEEDDDIKSGAYKGLDYWQRAIAKTLPGQSIIEIRNVKAVKAKLNYLDYKLDKESYIKFLFPDEEESKSSKKKKKFTSM